MPISIETIYLNINFNIPGSVNTYLTRNLFYFPSEEKKAQGGDDQIANSQLEEVPSREESKMEEEPENTEKPMVGGALSKYPYFTFDVKYPVDKLKQLGRENSVSLFFDKDQLLNFVSGQKIAASPAEKFENGNYNIMCMLGCMFPTNFPVSSNIQNSFESKIEKKINTSDEFDFSKDGDQFAYINVGGSAYTVTKTLWINDIINNLTFKTLLNELNKYNDWERKQKTELLKQIEAQKKKMIKVNKYFIKYYDSTSKVLRDITQIIEQERSYGYKRRDVLENMKVKRLLPDLKKEFDEFYSNQRDIDKLITISLKIKKITDSLSEDSAFIPKEFLTIAKYAKQINSDKTVLYVIEHPEYVKKLSKEMKEIVGKYKNINEIISIIKNFSAPKLNTSNIALQQLIDDFVKTKDTVSINVKGFAAYVRDVYINKAKNTASKYSTDLLNVGVALSNIPVIKNGKLTKVQDRQLNVQIQIDAFKGIITKDNIKCIHRNAVLEKLYESLTLNGDAKETVELDKIRPYLDFSAIKKQGGKSKKKRFSKRFFTRKLRNK